MLLTYVRSDDGWEGVYFNNKLVDEGNTINWSYGVLPRMVGVSFDSFCEISHDLERWGRCPQSLRELITDIAEAESDEYREVSFTDGTWKVKDASQAVKYVSAILSEVG